MGRQAILIITSLSQSNQDFEFLNSVYPHCSYSTAETDRVAHFVELGHEDLGEFFEILVVFLVDFGEGEAGSGLLVDELTEVCLSSDEAEGDVLLSAESGEEADHFDGVNIVGNNDELGLVLFDEGGNVVKTELEVAWLGGLA